MSEATAPGIRFDITIDAEDWSQEPLLELVDQVALVVHQATDKSGSAAVLFTDDVHIRDLNSQFRNKDAATNVLSFPAGPGAESGFLGDIAIAVETTRGEAETSAIALMDHVAHLLVHGTLHLFGYDHESDDEAETMEALETRILAMMNIADPYGADKE